MPFLTSIDYLVIQRMSLELGKSGSYIRGVTSGAALPSLKELFNIIAYFNMTPAEFFAPLEDDDSTLAYQPLPSLPSVIILLRIRRVHW